MQILLFRLFGHKPKTAELHPITKFTTTTLKNKPSFQEWVKEFNVSMLYDRKIVEMN